MRAFTAEEFEEHLKDLEVYLNRLRIEYEQYFLGNARREPMALRGKVQKLITRFVNEPPRNSAQKFRFNTLNSRFQVYRQHWGRTLREIEAGTYKRHRFKLGLSEAESASRPASSESAASEQPAKAGSAVDQLYDALRSAREKTGENLADLSRDKIERAVRRQTETLKEQHGSGARVRFRIVIEDGRAKLKAAVRS